MALQRVVQLLLLLFVGAAILPAADIDIPYTKYVLDNGLTLLVHEDHKAPIVAVNIWYHVGSKNEKPGKTGFAHLFEHLMFNGSENFDDDYFQAMERIGATDLNGTTSEDRTNYFQNVPTSALDIALWMESDRMGHLLGAVTQAKLDEQRGVVQNEKRQYENEPYAIAEELITTACFPKGHPYSWTVIGSMEDLDAASLEDVHQWFKTYYGPNNAVLVIAGDITPEVAYEKVKRYFGDIPPGPPIAKHQTWIAKRSGTHRQTTQDRVPQARLYRVWNIPEWGSLEGTYLDLVSDVLASGKNSRLYKRLVYEDQIATDVSAYVDLREIAGLFTIVATAKPGVELSVVEKAVDEELQKFLKTGPTEKELKRIKTQYRASFIRGIERIGGFGGKSDILASNMVFAGSPDFYKVTLDRVQKATAADLKAAAVKWLSDGDYVLTILPYPQLSAAAKSDVDRSKLPEAGEPPQASFPPLQRAELANGLKVVLVERHTIPVVNFQLLVDAGYAADPADLPGVARLTMDMLDEGTRSRTSLQINEELQMLGASLGTGSSLDVCSVSLNALKENLLPSLSLFADVILNPVFPEGEFARLQKETLARIQREKVTPVQMALRVFPGLLYGRDHSYGKPLTGSGTEASVSRMTRKTMVDFHQTWFKPNNATLIVVGDVTMAEVKPMLENLFKSWKPGEVPKKKIDPVQDKPSAVYIVDRPGSLQSVIFAGHLTLPRANELEEAVELMNNILGGDFTSRINMNLRENKHWTYGARSLVIAAKGQRMYVSYSPVQADKTAEAMVEIKKELEGIAGDRPPTEEEFLKTQSNVLLGLPGSWETISSIAGSAAEIVQYNLPDDYFQKYPVKLRAMTVEDVRRAAKAAVKPQALIWVIVGDRNKIEEPIKALGFGEIRAVDADGNLL
ncbi:MAG: insulinase family protein [candidate division KSB1 bacterium]|nr:insulinase family protein [candidate division KSB1 bacterium]